MEQLNNEIARVKNSFECSDLPAIADAIDGTFSALRNIFLCTVCVFVLVVGASFDVRGLRHALHMINNDNLL